MAEHSTIEWTDATWNPITGCTIVDAGCTNCYAMALAGSRLRNHPSRAGLTRVTGGRSKWTGEVRLNVHWMDQPLRWSRPRRIFVCAHGDLFHEAVPDEWIDRVFAVMALAPQHTFQVLTKRPERARDYLLAQLVYEGCGVMSRGNIIASAALGMDTARFMANGKMLAGWPLPNVWLGTSASDQASADLRIPHLLATPAAVRFLSAEPLLGPLVIDDMCDGWKFYDALRGIWWHDSEPQNIERGKPRLDWVIVGGESGPGARPMHPDWARSLRDQCVAAGVAFHFKQWGEWGHAVPKPSGTPGKYAIASAGPNNGFWAKSVIQTDSYPRQINLIGGATVRERVGKSRAGRLLDGRTWDQMPEVRHG
ncbi:protein gp37 [Gemmobacter caeni]|uniref:Protein gp37 n=1 Tax=Gemmobacter caeni TaxID=589035 RepID=A0A2T6ARV9_9RHOB|nr:phage Gp37/Gp68 family protein [Gemmobacter caeni]PTX46530.1 protein gp37 [Gemmobacter caeni]TWI95379.1 protein gp37 [Gemmobacter caeni]